MTDHAFDALVQQAYATALQIAEKTEQHGCTEEQRNQVASVIDVLVCSVGGMVVEEAVH